MSASSRLILTVSLLALLTLCGCGNGDRGTLLGSCDTQKVDGLCRAWAGNDKGSYEPYCTLQLGGTWSAKTACPDANLLGTCFYDVPGQYITLSYYPPVWGTLQSNPEFACTGDGKGVYTKR